MVISYSRLTFRWTINLYRRELEWLGARRRVLTCCRLGWRGSEPLASRWWCLGCCWVLVVPTLDGRALSPLHPRRRCPSCCRHPAAVSTSSWLTLSQSRSASPPRGTESPPCAGASTTPRPGPAPARNHALCWQSFTIIFHRMETIQIFWFKETNPSGRREPDRVTRHPAFAVHVL